MIDNCELIYDKDTKRMRGFGFIHFATEDAAEDVVNRKLFVFNNKQIEAKKAVPKEVISNSNAALRQQLEAQNITIPPVNPTSVAATAAGSATNQYLSAASIPTAAVALAASGGPTLPSLPLVNVSGLPQQRVPQTQPQPRLPVPSAMQQVALQNALSQQQGMEYLMPFCSNGAILPQPDLLNIYPYPQPTLINPNLNAADFAQSTLGTPFGGAPPTLTQFHPRASTSYATNVGLPASQQNLLNPNSHTGYETPNILQPAIMQSPAVFQQISAAALLGSFLQQHMHQQAVTAAAALQLQSSQVSPSLVSTPSTLAASNANSLVHAHALTDRQSVNPISNGQGVVIQQGPQPNISVNGQAVPTNAVQVASSAENALVVSQSSQAVTETNSASYSMPPKMPRTQ